MKKSSSKDLRTRFSTLLLGWNRKKNRRQMPWKGEKDPYKIWLSEIILQQTRVEQGLSYYNRFVEAFPTVQDLAKAQPEHVLKLWEGLGYYSRCRNLITAARFIAMERGGVFPDQYGEILSLKGVGPYTAAAIASFAYNLPYPVVDGNVFRVLARVFGIRTATDTTEGKRIFNRLAAELLDKKQPGLYNQAIMDFGATICKPVAPRCGQCVFSDQCRAFLENKVGSLPFKSKKIKIRKRSFYYLVLRWRGQIAVRCRSRKDIWQGLYEFPLVESGPESTLQEILREAVQNRWIRKGGFKAGDFSREFLQQLTHQQIRARFLSLNINTRPKESDWEWIRPVQAGQLAFPKLIRDFLESGGI